MSMSSNEQMSSQEELTKNKLVPYADSHSPQINQEIQGKSIRCSDYVKNNTFDAF